MRSVSRLQRCGELLEVEALPPGYPILFDFLPDLDGLYGEWERPNPETGYGQKGASTARSPGRPGRLRGSRQGACGA